MNPYEVLGVKKNASQKEIKNAYRKLSKTHHPDKGGKPEDFVKIQNAYDVLSDEKARKKYDETGDISSGIPLTAAGRNMLISIWEQLVDLDFRANQIIAIPDVLLSKLKQMKDSIRKKREMSVEDIAIYEKIKKRLIYKGEDNDFLKLTLIHKIQNANDNVKRFNRRVEEIESAEKLAKDYDYMSEFKDEKSFTVHMLGDGLTKGFNLT